MAFWTIFANFLVKTFQLQFLLSCSSSINHVWHTDAASDCVGVSCLPQSDCF